eukprot:448757-Pleurochrysis_carterae.AAC.1
MTPVITQATSDSKGESSENRANQTVPCNIVAAAQHVVDLIAKSAQSRSSAHPTHSRTCSSAGKRRLLNRYIVQTNTYQLRVGRRKYSVKQSKQSKSALRARTCSSSLYHSNNVSQIAQTTKIRFLVKKRQQCRQRSLRQAKGAQAATL